jgi:alpha-mannosidase
MRFSRQFSFITVVILLVFAVVTSTAQPRPSAQPAKPPERYNVVLDRLNAMTNAPVNQWRYHTGDLPHPEDPSLDDSNWTAVTFGRGQSGSANTLGWYRTWLEIPTTVGGKDTRGARVRLALRVSSLARVFFNGSMVAQGNGNLLLPILIAEKAVPGQRILVAVSTNRMTGGQLTFEFPGKADPGTLREEIQTAVAIMAGFPAGNAEREKQLDAVVKSIDIAALDRGDQQAFDKSLIAAENDMAPLREWMKQFTVRAVGNSHIDMAWLWPWTETVEVVRDTYTTALQLMREYPDFTYTQSSAQTFEWLEQKYPDLFRQIQERVKEGRI